MDFRKLCGTAALAASLLALPAVAATTDQASGASHQYIYYPAKGIYQDPARKLWFYNEDGAWRGEETLPGHLQQWTTKGKKVTLATDKPYEHQADMERRFGAQVRYEQTAEAKAMLRQTQQAMN